MQNESCTFEPPCDNLATRNLKNNVKSNKTSLKLHTNILRRENVKLQLTTTSIIVFPARESEFLKGKSLFDEGKLQTPTQYIEHLCRVKLVSRFVFDDFYFNLFSFPFCKKVQFFALVARKKKEGKKARRQEKNFAQHKVDLKSKCF